MGDKRQKLKRHIRAAKEWLGQAENSLDKEDELSSELKIMLAKAELKRAAEADGARSRRRKILMRMKNLRRLSDLLMNMKNSLAANRQMRRLHLRSA